MFRYQKFDTISTTFLSPIERVVEFTPRGIEAATVLSLAVDTKILSTTPNDGYVEVGGRAEFKLIYADLDGNASSSNYNADFTVRLEGDVCLEDKVKATLKAIEWSASSTDSLTLSAVVKVAGVVTKTLPLDMLVHGENSFSTMKKLTLPKHIISTSTSFPVDEETTVGEVEKVLSLDTKTALAYYSTSDGQVDISVTTVAVVTYVEGGNIRTATFDVTSDESVSLDGLKDTDKLMLCPYVKSGRIVLAGVTGENILRFEGEIGVSIEGVRYEEVEIVDDLFMLTHETTVKKTSTDLLAYCCDGIYREKISGEVDLPRGEDCTLVALPATTAFVAKTVYDESLTVEGVASAEIIYSCEDTLYSTRAEVPFSLNINGDFTENTKASVTVLETGVKIRGNKAEINMTLAVETSSYCNLNFSYINSVELGAEKEVNRSGLSLYVADEGDGLWEVCKALTATPEEIQEQNPTLVFPLKFGEKVLFFRHLTA